VKYMVQNTLGRMWLDTYPESGLRDKMEYYIEPAEQEPEVQAELDRITPKDLNPEEITFLDPACGSGHILIEAYGVFKEIYQERGYRSKDIPRLILEKNIFGLDICDRAAQLACFAVLMKAREDDRRILGRDDLKLNVMAIQESDPSDVKDIGIFFKDDEDVREGLKSLVKLFAQAKTFGSLISVPENLSGKREQFKTAIQNNTDWMFRYETAESLERLTRQAEVLEQKHDCVVTNPPYMGNKGMNNTLKNNAKIYYADSKSDIFAMLTEKILSLTERSGFVGLVMPYVWMFLSSYESFRKKMISNTTLNSLIQLEYNAFEPACVPVATFTLFRHPISQYKGDFIKLSEFKGHQNQAPKTLEAIQDPSCDWRYIASATDFKKIPGSPIAYWLPKQAILEFEKCKKLQDIASPKQGLATANNDTFVRCWYEVEKNNFAIGLDQNKAQQAQEKWFPYNKGGGFRKWYGNQTFVINWHENGHALKQFEKSVIRNPQTYFKPSLSWSKITSSLFALRFFPEGFIYDVAGCSIFLDDQHDQLALLGVMNSKIMKDLVQSLSPTLNFEVGQIAVFPVSRTIIDKSFSVDHVSKILNCHKNDWNSYETSWDFRYLPMTHSEYKYFSLKTTYKNIRTHWRTITTEIKCLEEKNNHIFIEAYGLQEELTPVVPLSEITLTCNPHYRYGGNKTEDELEALLQTDTIKELISYSIGCMMGRYSLDHPGLIYAHSGNIDFDPSKYKTFPADDDGIIPIMDQEWFADDATTRFVEFLKKAWPPEYLEENLKFVADSLKPKTNESSVDTIRRYLSTGFFKVHLKTYKKRPIYWLFSSGRLRAFECLVYLHRYNESTLSRMRSSYVTPLQGHFTTRIEFLQNEKDAATTASARNKLQKQMELIKKKLAELRKFDDELRHYADIKVSLDLDDGVKVNYGKFGHLLAETKAITGKK